MPQLQRLAVGGDRPELGFLPSDRRSKGVTLGREMPESLGLGELLSCTALNMGEMPPRERDKCRSEAGGQH